MFWQEPTLTPTRGLSERVVDLSFRINCRTLPLDHAYPLSEAILAMLPWLAEELDAGIHLIHGAASGNGWTRPDDPTRELLHLSRRTRLTLRLPRERLDDALRLSGATLPIAGHLLRVETPSVRVLSPSDTLFARYVVAAEHEDEQCFVEQAVAALADRHIQVRKLLCGMTHSIATPQARIFTRSVMVAGLNPEESLLLQQKGLGPARKLGCGLFVPHKGVEPVGTSIQH